MSTRNQATDPLLVGPTTRPPTPAAIRDLPSCAGGQVLPVGADLSVELRAVRPAGGDAAGDAEVLVCDGPLPDPAPAGICAAISRTAPPNGYPIPVIVLGRDASWNAVFDDLADLFGAHRGRRVADRARTAFRVPLTDGRGFTGLVDVCRDLVGAPVAVLDDYLDVLAEVGVDDQETQQLDGAVRDARGRGAATPLDAFISAAAPDIPRMLVLGPGERPVLVVAAWLPSPLTIGQTAVLREMAEACGIEWGRQDGRTQTQSPLRGD